MVLYLNENTYSKLYDGMEIWFPINQIIILMYAEVNLRLFMFTTDNVINMQLTNKAKWNPFNICRSLTKTKNAFYTTMNYVLLCFI